MVSELAGIRSSRDARQHGDCAANRARFPEARPANAVEGVCVYLKVHGDYKQGDLDDPASETAQPRRVGAQLSHTWWSHCDGIL